jgi:hypothetical protein
MPPAAAPLSFAIECPCGTWARGERRPQSQTLACPHCGKSLFVFPLAPPAFGPIDATIPWPAGAWRTRLRFWLPPALAALLALAVVGAVIAAIVRGYRPAAGDQALTETQAIGVLDARLAAARDALTDGSYRLARRELDAAHALHARFPRLLDADRARQLARWRRQAALLADLLPESVGEILRHSVGLAEREWDDVFRERYAGRSVVLDTRVFRDAGGHYHVDYQLEAAGGAGAWELDRLRLFDWLPLQRPQRLLFGFRLQALRRLARDHWSVIPEPDSGVLLTDPLVLAGLSVPADGELLEVMRRQAAWEGEMGIEP